MNRRGFLGAILAAATAPAIVRADSLMRIIPRDAVLVDPYFASVQRIWADGELIYGNGNWTIEGWVRIGGALIDEIRVTRGVARYTPASIAAAPIGWEHRVTQCVDGVTDSFVLFPPGGKTMTTQTTLCWRCNATLFVDLPKCPRCDATNANQNIVAAYAEMVAEQHGARQCGDVSGPYRCNRNAGHKGPHGTETANWPNHTPPAVTAPATLRAADTTTRDYWIAELGKAPPASRNSRAVDFLVQQAIAIAELKVEHAAALGALRREMEAMQEGHDDEMRRVGE